MSDFLSSMAAASLMRAEGVRTDLGAGELERRIRSARPALPLGLSEEGFDLIAEVKLASPSEGPLSSDLSGTAVQSISSSLADSGAAALSVLTEPAAFGGELNHLRIAAANAAVPVMRKDFIVDPIQVLEARAMGASGVLLIARLLEKSLLREMTDLALDLSMFVLVEIFEEPDLEVASAVFDREVLVGVNSRDLASLQVDPRRHEDLYPLLPSHLPAVAESGLLVPGDAASVAAIGYRLGLVGSSLVRSGSPRLAAEEMIAAGRSRVGAAR